MFRTTNVQNKWKFGPSEGILFHFPPKTPLSAGNVPAPISAAERSAAPSPACTRSVRSPQRPIRLRVVPSGSSFVPPGSCIVSSGSFVVPPGSRMIPPRPHAGHDCQYSLPVPTSPQPVFASLRQPLLSPGRAAKEAQNKKNRHFFGVFVKLLLLLRHIAVTTLYPRRNGLHAASASLLTRGIPMTGDVPAAGSEQHTETIYL